MNLNEIRASEPVVDVPRMNSAESSSKMKLAFGTKVSAPNQQSNNFTQSIQLKAKVSLLKINKNCFKNLKTYFLLDDTC